MPRERLAEEPASVSDRTPLLTRSWRARTRPRLEVVTFGCEPGANNQPPALGLTYWFETEQVGDPYAVNVRFSGRRIDVKAKPSQGDSFRIVECLGRVIPGSGPVAITARVGDVEPGEWRVTAAATTERGRRTGRRGPITSGQSRLPSASTSGVTGWGPVIQMLSPGSRVGAWPCLVGVGGAVALSVQWLLSRRSELPAGRVLVISLVASLFGLVGAKAYYLVEHRGRPQRALTAGMCIQGFVLGAISALVIGALIADVPVGTALDVTAPGLMFGMAIGRLGCFFGGCCAGRPTGSRWGVWSSDRRLGVRRIPTQLIESSIALSIGVVTLLVVRFGTPRSDAAAFVTAIAAFTLGRQAVFPLRDLPRHTTHGRLLTMVLAATVIAVELAASVLR